MCKKGFTLVELMLVVTLIAILAAVAMPKTNTLLRHSKQARTLANLASMRSAIAMYFTDHEGTYPLDDLSSLTQNERYLRQIPIKDTSPYHPSGNTVTAGNAAAQADSRGDWFYFNDPLDPQFGRIEVNCIHQDGKGKIWTNY